MRLVLTSDWHGELPSDLPEGDFLIIAGDLLPAWNHAPEFQFEWYIDEFLPHIESLGFDRTLFVAGNHDFLFENSFVDGLDKYLPKKVHYMQDQALEFDGVKFYGTPWSMQFGNWAFMAKDEILAPLYGACIPKDTDVLITHGPPYGAGDQTSDRYHPPLMVGSPSLAAWIEENQPKLVVTGHIHEAYGEYEIGNTVVRNVSMMDLDYEPVNPAVVFDIDS